jgi:hypothetical protein
MQSDLLCEIVESTDFDTAFDELEMASANWSDEPNAANSARFKEAVRRFTARLSQ